YIFGIRLNRDRYIEATKDWSRCLVTEFIRSGGDHDSDHLCDHYSDDTTHPAILYVQILVFGVAVILSPLLFAYNRDFFDWYKKFFVGLKYMKLNVTGSIISGASLSSGGTLSMEELQTMEPEGLTKEVSTKNLK